MNGLKGAFLTIVAIAVAVQAYLLLDFVVPKTRSKIRRSSPETNAIMLSHVSRLELEGRYRLEHRENVNDKQTENVHDKHTEDVHNETLILTDDGKSRNTSHPSSGQCLYRVRVYNNFGVLTEKRPGLKNIVDQSRREGRSDVRANVSCSKECTVEIMIAGDEDAFAGMDAVVFHFMKSLVPNPLPPANLNPNQTWVYFSWESPWSNAHENGRIAKLPVHAVWTYYRGSDIPFAYGYYDAGTPMAKETKSVEEWMQGKTKLAAWMASNCGTTTWPRTDFVRQLSKHIPIDMYGHCGNLKCSPSWSTKCTVDLMRKYKFYFSLENAECDDYITEKLWNKPLMQGVVPIVYGAKRKAYEELLPPNSFIYIGDYKNLSELADNLKLLDAKPELYVEYLKWQYQGSVRVNQVMHEPYDPAVFCELIPFIDRVKRGKLKRTPVGQSSFPKTCRNSKRDRMNANSTFGVGKWNPW